MRNAGRDGGMDLFWSCGLNMLVRTSADPDTAAGDPKRLRRSEAWDVMARCICACLGHAGDGHPILPSGLPCPLFCLWRARLASRASTAYAPLWPDPRPKRGLHEECVQAAGPAGNPAFRVCVCVCVESPALASDGMVHVVATLKEDAEAGHAEAQFSLGEMYAEGLGVQ